MVILSTFSLLTTTGMLGATCLDMEIENEIAVVLLHDSLSLFGDVKERL